MHLDGRRHARWAAGRASQPDGGRASGVALLAGGYYERLGILHAGEASTKDPKYVVQPQRERKQAREVADHAPQS